MERCTVDAGSTDHGQYFVIYSTLTATVLNLKSSSSREDAVDRKLRYTD